MSLKLATEEDYPSVLRMARSFHLSSPYRGMSFDDERCRQLWNTYLSDKTRVIIILMCTVEPVGMIIGLASELPFSRDLATMEVAWWVDEEHRGTKDSIMLMKAYEDWSVRIGAKMTQMAMLDESTDLQKFYTRSGYKPAERSFIKGVM